MSRPERPGRRGFTLVEVITALMVVAIVLPTVMHGVVLCLDLSVHARMRAEAASLAQAKLSELAATRMIDQTVQTDDFGEHWPQYAWTAEVGTWYDSRLIELDVTVMWMCKGREHGVTVSTLVYDSQGGSVGSTGVTSE